MFRLFSSAGIVNLTIEIAEADTRLKNLLILVVSDVCRVTDRRLCVKFSGNE